MLRWTACAFFALTANFALADLDTIIPRPKEIRALGNPVPLADFRIVVHKDERAQIGAREINERIISLGKKSLPVLPLQASLPPGKSIVIAPCSAKEISLAGVGLEITPTNPGEQGYVIHPVGAGDNLRLFLLGSDSLGTLYAAVTLRQLIIRRGDELLLQLAEVRDWPDYKYRQMGTPFSEPLRRGWYSILGAEREGDLPRARELAREWVAFQKRYFDWMLRAKINFAWNSTNIRPGDAPKKTTVVRAALREVHEYGLARGIESMAGDTTAIGTYPRDKDNPDFRDVVFHRAHKRYFCWSRLEYHRRRARRAAQWLADAGYTGYFLHATDGGGWRNPALWNDRCPLCRQTYGDDHAKADATVFGIYYREVKKRIPNLKFVAVVYPYTGRYLDPEYIYQQAAATMGEGEPARALAQQTVRKLTDFLQRLNTLLPPDIFVCIRESERRHLALARQVWGRRRFQLYYEYAYWKGWRPYFITTPLWTKSMYYPTHDDILYGNVPVRGWTEVTQLLGAECAWNVNRPGAREFDTRAWHELGTKQAPPPERQTFATRACRFLFGEEAGPLIAPVYAENISHTFIAFPEEVMQRVDIEDPVQTMREQAQATARAAASLERLWELQQRGRVLTGDWYGYFLNLYLMTQGARILATHRAHILAARRAIQHGDRAEVEKQLSAARTFLARAATEWAAIQKKVPRDQLFASYLRRTAAPGYLSQLRVSELQKEVEDLWNRREALMAAHTIPGWFERSCRRREIVAVPAGGPITVDGRLDEPVWAEAPPIEHFVDYRVLRLEALETQARLAYDANALYAAFECFDPNPMDISVTLPARDEHVLCDSVEILLAPPGESREFVHWIVDSKGTVFDARSTRTPEGMMKYSVRWNGSAQVKVVRGTDRWTVEMRIPAADLGFRPQAGLTGRALLCRNIVHTKPKGEEESNAIVFLEGSGFHTGEKFARLRFAPPGERFPAPQVELVLRPLRFAHETTGEGAGTRIGGDLRIETDRNLHNFRLRVRCTDGRQPLGRRELGTAPLVQLMWRPKEPFSLLFSGEVPGVVCTFTVTSREGTWTFVRRFGHPRRTPIPPNRLYTAGVDGLALARPAFFSSFNPRTIQLSEGTVEFWVKPHWDVVPRPPGPRGWLEHTFFNLGPIRPDHPYLSNRDSLTIFHSAGGYLSGIISNSNYEARTVQADIRDWRKGQWHHVALQWKLDDGGKTAMALFIDGKLASDRCLGSAKSPNTQPLQVKPLPLPIQIGSMNTGFRPAEADLDELRLSSIRRYKGAFTPKKRFEPDAHTLALFHFDGTLNATVPKGVTATPGPAQ
ncbi:MAG TPA: hypothetical protein EYP85_07125 [Armatimonadetes bacterium]|nr:hypothetical protein [Armatimonadota bacterium]